MSQTPRRLRKTQSEELLLDELELLDESDDELLEELLDESELLELELVELVVELDDPRLSFL